MAQSKKWDIIIIGGGLAGLTCALHLATRNCKVLLIEKYTYPHHKVCGEYVSNEVLPYLKSLGVDPFGAGAKIISKFEISTKTGKLITTTLPLGGFGISRFAFDNQLYEAVKAAAEVLFDTVASVDFSNELFTITTQGNLKFKANYVIGAFGKRSGLDGFLKRKFIQQKSPWLAVKAHYDYNFPEDTVALHNFEGGYCGLSKTETNAVNACYLTTYKSFKHANSITDFQKKTLSKNPYLQHFFEEAIPLFEKPLTISQISFQKKKPVEDHIFMIGDAAGLIHPLCGNGMAMAIHSAKLFSELYLDASAKGIINRAQLENTYTQLWQKTFAKRLSTGRKIQQLLLHPTLSTIGFNVAKTFPGIVPKLIQKTHGNPL
ncbi:flavin-dependent dehydrogenase [Ulvibacter sp. MAR_2010_11]|uniref:NAD(P)/FAD-dependent oxidoreductase n=1 Tax=Ulvibacter sp. MAR_2010_11 TaxID=1250229 RepID=UPI000C2C4511|nr:NAD(P)/FAD-dependent oxidoreductase [Ulvibacter sp. MAR_2010_11]PKA84196.1 flavin-dependent dehydrogenase [Ulvibacter sp. MAR_2010_11]